MPGETSLVEKIPFLWKRLFYLLFLVIGRASRLVDKLPMFRMLGNIVFFLFINLLKL